MSIQKSPLPARRVRRLHVRADAEDDARHAATLLSDALSTASLPGADRGRLIVIQRLALGRISAHVSPASLALRIERVTRDVMSQAVAYDVPAAGDANAVVFSDRGDAIIALARLHARGAPAREWFWTAIVRGWRADASRGERWSLLLQAAHGVPEAAVVAAALIDQAIGAGVEDALLSSIPAGQGGQWLRMEGWSGFPTEPLPSRPPHLTRRRAEIVNRWRRNWGPTDDRLVWLTTLLTVLEHPAAVADPRLPAKVAFILRAFEREGPPHSDSQSERVTRVDRPGVPEDPAPEVFERASAPQSHPQSSGDSDRRVSFAGALRPTPIAHETFDRPSDIVHSPGSRVGRKAEQVHAPKTLCGAFTPCAGLLFVVPILERLEFAAFLASQPTFLDGGLPARLLWFIGQRVGLPPNDPLALAFHAEFGDQADPVFFETGDLASHLPGRARDILSSPKPRAPLDSPFTAWLTAVRRWSRRHPRMGLTTLIRRPGRVHISRTHIGACFALSQIDVRVRRLALDVDPGWVPWMGRVVQFSYGDHHGPD